MESNRLDELAGRFWEGNCTEAEELELKQAVLYGSIPERHAALQSYFSFTEESRNEEGLGEVFDKQMLNAIARKEESSSFPSMKMAAGMALLVGLFFVWQSTSGPDVDSAVQEEIVIVDTYEDPEVAYREVKKALMMIGGKMNEGVSYAGSISEFEKAKKEIEIDSSAFDTQSKK